MGALFVGGGSRDGRGAMVGAPSAVIAEPVAAESSGGGRVEETRLVVPGLVVVD